MKIRTRSMLTTTRSGLALAVARGLHVMTGVNVTGCHDAVKRGFDLRVREHRLSGATSACATS